MKTKPTPKPRRGRPPLPPGEAGVLVRARVPERLVALGQAAAEREGIPWGTWLRQAIVRRIMDTVRGEPPTT